MSEQAYADAKVPEKQAPNAHFPQSRFLNTQTNQLEAEQLTLRSSNICTIV